MATADVVTIASGTTGAVFRNARAVVGTNAFGAIYAIDTGIDDVSTSGQLEERWTNRFDDPDYYGGANDSIVSEIANLELWLKADFITTLADGDLVTTWPDASANSRDAAQGTTSQKPTFVLREPTAKNKSVVRFATDDSLDTPAVTAIGQPTTIFSIWRSTSFGPTHYVYDGNQNLTHRQRLGLITGPKVEAWALSSVSYSIPDGKGLTLTTVEYNGASSQLFENGALKVAGDMGDKGWDGLTIGADYTDTGSNFDGDIAEIIVYSALLTTTERNNVETYLRAKYNIGQS